MTDYTGKNIVIVGLGITGFSCINYFLSKGIYPYVIDTRSEPQWLDKLDINIKYHVGGFNMQWLLNADLIILSPGLTITTPEIQAAIKNGAEVIGDIELFCREINQQSNAKIIAITGSNGKTTVTTLMAEVAKQAGLTVAVGGNIGEPALNLLNQHSIDLYILELSSFQLETTYTLRPDVATILNISDDHLDRYPKGISQYRQAKLRIYQQAKKCIVNQDDQLTFPENPATSNIIFFGLQQTSYCLDLVQGALCVSDRKVITFQQIALQGIHNYLNCLVVLAMADAIGLPQEAVLAVFSTFRGLPHRFQLVHEDAGIKWIDDSKATNVGSTLAALQSIHFEGQLHLLLGGDGKSADFSPLIPYLNADNITIYCFGKDRKQLSALKSHSVIVTETMEEAIFYIKKQAIIGDVVLLSPACASIDQFRNYIERGLIFAQLAKG